MPSRSKIDFIQSATLSQRLAVILPEYVDYAGSDPRVSLKLARLRILGKHGLIDMEDPEIKLMWDLLNEDRKALFATSENVNEISKMGFQMPSSEDEYDKPED